MKVQVAALCISGAYDLGYRLGQKASKGEATDWLCLKHGVDRGYVKLYEIRGMVFMGPAGLPFKEFKEIDPEFTDADVQALLGPGPPICRCMPYKVLCSGGQLCIPSSELPEFMKQNGISLINEVNLQGLLLASLSRTLLLDRCEILAKYDIGRKGLMGGLIGLDCSGMRPGDIMMSLHMEKDFKEYLADPIMFEDNLKSLILDALGLDPRRFRNAKHNIQIKDVRAGSIKIIIVITFGLLLAASLVGYVRGWVANQPVAHVAAAASPAQPARNSSVSVAAAGSPAQRAPTSFNANPKANRSSGVVAASSSSAADTHTQQGAVQSLQCVVPTSGASTINLAVDSVHLENHVDGDWTLILSPKRSKCYVKQTIMRTATDTLTQVANLRPFRDWVISHNGKHLQVVWKEVHARSARDLVTLRTAQAELTVTSDHRIPIASDPQDPAHWEDRDAGSLKVGDLVICGLKPQKLTKVLRVRRKVEVVELQFDPDDPVEAMLVPSWGILTRGAPHRLGVRNTFIDDISSSPALPMSMSRSQSLPCVIP